MNLNYNPWKIKFSSSSSSSSSLCVSPSPSLSVCLSVCLSVSLWFDVLARSAFDSTTSNTSGDGVTPGMAEPVPLSAGCLYCVTPVSVL